MESIWRKCKVLTEWSPKRQVYEFIDCRQILNKEGVPYTMDLIRCDTGERVYFVGITQSLEMIWTVEKYTTLVVSSEKKC
jgi:hypothetical protein